MFLDRNIEKKIECYLNDFPVIVLTGVRQCGKTTLARHVRPDWKYFDLEKGSDFDFITADFDLFFNQYDESVIIDEAQISPQVFRELRGVVDNERGKKGRFILTGSSSPELKKQISESLAGRVAVIEVGTMKLNERYRKDVSGIYEILTRASVSDHLRLLQKMTDPVCTQDVLMHFFEGGYPELVVNSDKDFRLEWFEQYFDSYIQRDMKALFPGLQSENYRRFVRMLSGLSGTTINRSQIGRALSVSEGAIRNYLDIAEGTYVWRNIPSLESTVSKSVVKMGRGYVRDSGLMHYLQQINNIDRVLSHAGTGYAFEGFVTEEIIQGLNSVSLSRWGCNYYRTRGGREVDLVLTSPDAAMIPVEIKFGTSTKRNEIKPLAAFIEQENLDYGILINNSNRLALLAHNIIQIPAGYL